MTLPVLCIRPEPGLSDTIAKGRGRGLEIVSCPLSIIEPVSWDAPNASAFDALLIGSANVFRHGGAQLAEMRALPVCAVGESTAVAAREAGFCVTKTGRGGLQSLVDHASAQPMRYLRLGGEERVPLSLATWQSMEEIAVYRSKLLKFPEDCARLLQNGAYVLLHSAAAARHFTHECKRLGVDKATITLLALGPRIAESVGAGWAKVATACAPTDDALLALTENMCQ